MLNERRKLLKMVAAGPAGALLLPLFAPTGRETLAAEVEKCADATGQLPENVIYTQARQGVWKGKAGSHVPLVEVKKVDGKIKLSLQTKHGMSERHYIVRHTVVNGLGKVLGAHTFHWDDEPVSEHEIEIPPADCGKSHQLFAMSYCSLHDLWLVQTKLEV